ncbi:MAG: penicillin acylase family protein [Halioglobus sp.]
MKLRSIIYPLLMPLLVGCNTGAQEASPANVEGEKVTIYRDEYGTPQVVADSNKGVYFGYGYAVATDRLFQMEMLKRTAEGRVAEALGQEFAELDVHLRTTYDHRSVALQLEDLPAEQRDILSGYAAGFNMRIDEVLTQNGDLLPIEFSDYDFLPEHWSAYDVAMAFVGSIAHRYADFNSERDNLALLQNLEEQHGKAKAWRVFNASKWLVDGNSPTTVPRGSAANSIPAEARPGYLDQLAQTGPNHRVALAENGRFKGITKTEEQHAESRQRIAAHGFSHNPEFTGASNYWSARNLEDAAAALVNGPQFGFGVPSYVYGIGLHGGDFNVVGNTLLALPTLLFAHNNHIAWGSTAGISDQTDEYVLTLNSENSEQYRHGEEWKAFESWPETIAVKGGEPITATARRSVHGMVQVYQPEKNIAWTRARSWEGGELDTLMAWVFLATDTSLDAAHQRIGAMATNINMYTMDKSGNLGYVHSGRYPARAEGHDPRLPASGDGQWDWQGLRPYSDNPTVRNPEQGYIANWNNRPAADWISSDLWPYTWSRADRARLIFEKLERDPSTGNPKLNVADVRDVNLEITFADVNAPFLLPLLFDAWEEQTQTEQITAALSALSEWDKQWPVDANGQYGSMPALMEVWLRTLMVKVFADDIGDEFFHLYAATNYPNGPQGASMGTPPGIKALVRNLDRLSGDDWSKSDYDFFNGENPSAIIRAGFAEGLESLVADQGENTQSWQLAAEPMQWKPYNFRGVPQARETAVYTLPSYMNRGSENNLFVATGKGINSWDVIPPGQSGWQSPDGERGPHTDDQMKLYADFGYKQVPFDVDEVRAAAVSTKVIRWLATE